MYTSTFNTEEKVKTISVNTVERKDTIDRIDLRLVKTIRKVSSKNKVSISKNYEFQNV